MRLLSRSDGGAFTKWPKYRLKRDVTSEAEHVLETMWTRCRLFGHVAVVIECISDFA